MKQMALALAFGAMTAVAGGCRMCASPYDYCGPVVPDDCCVGAQCHGTARAGSILSGMPGVVADPDVLHPIPEPELDAGYSQAAPEYSPPGPTPSRHELDYAFANDPEIRGGKIISITDRKVEEAESEVADVGGDEIPSSGGGWSAREISTGAP